jgi:hypothetical protein
VAKVVREAVENVEKWIRVAEGEAGGKKKRGVIGKEPRKFKRLTII